MSSSKTLQGKAAIVTGAARNMGRAFCERLAELGADVTVHHHGPASRLDAEGCAKQVEKAGSRAVLVEGDLSKKESVTRLFEATTAAFGRVDIVINNAGVLVKKPFTAVTEEDFDRCFNTNAKAAFFVMQEAAQRLSDFGRIINMGTTILGATIPNYSVYAGSKAPLEDFSRALAKEIGGRGITVNTVAPGPIDTPFYWASETAESAALVSSLNVGKRLGRIEDVVPMIEFLASPASQWVTAQTLFINGGFLAR
jgi:NAD(P)-dependent dehydrogenase (short-subunit alcohol dehydrogenase family)